VGYAQGCQADDCRSTLGMPYFGFGFGRAF